MRYTDNWISLTVLAMHRRAYTLHQYSESPTLCLSGRERLCVCDCVAWHANNNLVISASKVRPSTAAPLERQGLGGALGETRAGWRMTKQKY